MDEATKAKRRKRYIEKKGIKNEEYLHQKKFPSVVMCHNNEASARFFFGLPFHDVSIHRVPEYFINDIRHELAVKLCQTKIPDIAQETNTYTGVNDTDKDILADFWRSDSDSEESVGLSRP